MAKKAQKANIKNSGIDSCSNNHLHSSVFRCIIGGSIEAKMLPRVKKVEYLDGYRLKIQFTNGKTKIVDLEERLEHGKNLFLDLKDLAYFKKVECDGYSICWPNGIDYCPDLLYTIGQDVKLSKPRRKTFSKTPRARKLARAKKTKSIR